MVDEDCSRGDEIWLQNPYALTYLPFWTSMFTLFRMPFELYGEALVLTRSDDNEAAKMLRRAMLGIESVSRTAQGLPQLIRTRVFLSRALRNIGEEDEAKIQCVKKSCIVLFYLIPMRSVKLGSSTGSARTRV
jgi:hypothetical protein